MIMFEVYEYREQNISLFITSKLKALPTLFHKHMEFIYVLDGEFTTNIDGIEKTMKKGDLAVTFPFIMHTSKESDAAFMLLLFDPQICGGFYDRITKNKPMNPFIMSQEQSDSLSALLHLMLLKMNDTSEYHTEIITAYINALVGETLACLKLKQTDYTSLTTAQRILFYCTNNYKNNITLNTLADHLFLSKTHITHTFKLKIGISLRNYINSLRIHNAMNLLRHTELNITEIMYECGYTNQSTFNRAFFALCGMTPREYRKKTR
jgi:AraC-like DNA-binding protein